MRIWLLVSGVALLAAIPPIWPYAYFTLLRLLVCGVAVAAIVVLRSGIPTGRVISFAFVTVLFNPVVCPHPLDLGVLGCH